MIRLKTKHEFEKFIQDNDVCCVKFGAEWCGPCKVLSKTIENAEKNGLNYPIAECDIDDEEIFELGSEFGVKNIPFICIFKGGELKDMNVGSISMDTLNNKVNSLE